MLKKIYQELVNIRKELQAIRSSKEPFKLSSGINGEIIMELISHSSKQDRRFPHGNRR